jgi:methionyl aminopeptidase
MTAYPRLKTRAEVLRIRRSAVLLRRLFAELDAHIVPGVSPRQLSEFTERFAAVNRARCAQLGYNDFPAAICASVNDTAAHGVPTDRQLANGDLITVDCVLSVDGWHSDAAWSYAVGQVDPDGRRLLRAAWQTTRAAVNACRAGTRFGAVGQAAERVARSYGCSIVSDFTGHGIGRELHEEPQIPFGAIHGEGSPIVPGLVVTIEPVVTLGEPRVKPAENGHGYVTVDGSRTAQYECTLAVFSDYTEVLTLDNGDMEAEFPPFV